MNMHIAPTEVLEIALTIEERGAIFYRRAAAHTPDKAVADLCLRLADDEDKHHRLFEAMYDDKGVPVEIYQGDLEAHAYLRAIAASQTFKPVQDSELSDPASLLAAAVRMEKESLLYYQHLRSGASPSAAEVLDDIIVEERRHVVILSQELDRL